MFHFNAGHVELVKLLRKHGAKWEAVDNAGAGPLHWAVDGGNVELVKWMLNDGCSVCIQCQLIHVPPADYSATSSRMSTLSIKVIGGGEAFVLKLSSINV